jgi:hypothetical protein
LDNDGNALIVGALYFDTTTGKMRVFTAGGWLDASSASVATLAQFQFNATASQTTFSGTAAVGGSLTYTVGAVLVALNGVLLEETSDFTASNGTSIVLASGAASGDELNVYAFGNFLVADTYSRGEANSTFLPQSNPVVTGVISVVAGGANVMRASDGATGSSMFHFTDQNTYFDNVKGGDQVFRGGAGFTERLRVVPGGIQFPAAQVTSANANTLDDYEEGTWTPAFLTGGGNTFTQSGTGIYTKIGNMVTASGIVIWTAKSGSGGLQISLPFTTTANGSWRGGVVLGTVVNMSVVSSTRFMIASLDPSSAFFSIRYINNGATWGPLDPSNMGTNGEFQFSVFYPVS